MGGQRELKRVGRRGDDKRLTAGPPKGGGRYRLRAPRADTTPKIVRDWPALLLTGFGHREIAEQARLCASEAVTHAPLHTRVDRITVEAALGSTPSPCPWTTTGPDGSRARAPSRVARRTGPGTLIRVHAADLRAVSNGGLGKRVQFTLAYGEAAAWRLRNPLVLLAAIIGGTAGLLAPTAVWASLPSARRWLVDPPANPGGSYRCHCWQRVIVVRVAEPAGGKRRRGKRSRRTTYVTDSAARPGSASRAGRSAAHGVHLPCARSRKTAKSEPTGHGLPFSTWSLAELADFLVAEGVVDDASHEGLRILLREKASLFNA